MTDTDPADLQAQMLAAAPDIDLSFRKMFGGIMGYAADLPFASLSNVGLALKFTPTEREKALALEGAKPLQYEPTAPPSKSYVVMPAHIVADSAQLHDWIVASANGLMPKAKAR